LHGEAKLAEFKNDEKTKKSSYFCSDDASNSTPAIKTEKTVVSISSVFLF
jgi:hypothetical protein